MAEDQTDIRRQRGAGLLELAREDLDFFSVEDLQERIAALEAEIGRARAQIGRKQSGRAAAEALFAQRD
jgi:uncharacterized small protein (DUF1192 family)